jgi:outer membrane lipoprotein-sorting protein
VWEKKPNQFRAEVLDASDPEHMGAITVASGGQVWMYHPSRNEVVVGEVGPDEPASPRDLLQSVDEVIQRVLDTSEVKLVGEEDVAGRKTYKLDLTPTDDEEALLPVGGQATVWVDQENWVILKAHVTGDLVGEGWMTVESFELDPDLDDSVFHFEAPEDARITDLDDLRPKPVTLDEARAHVDFPLLVPGYLPDGVTLVEALTMGEAVILHYDHSATSFTVVQGTIDDRMPLPTGTQETEVSLRGGTATVFSDGAGSNLLTWEEDGVVITIAGHISQDEIVKVAESLQ